MTVNYEGEKEMKQCVTKKIISGLIAGSITISFGAVALANGQQDLAANPRMLMHNIDITEHREQHISTSLNHLVAEKFITQDQADKLIKFFKEKDKQQKTERETIKDKSPEESDSQQQPCNKYPDIVQELKDIADLSDEQANAVADAARPPHRPGPEDRPHCCHIMPHP